jgi:hypothetical protein
MKEIRLFPTLLLLLLVDPGHALPMRPIAAPEHYSMPAGGEKERPTFACISGKDRGASISINRRGSVETVLSLNQLPTAIEGVPAGLANERFRGALLSPDGYVVGFAVAGHVDWVGTLDLRTRTVFAILPVPAGSADTILAWSPDSRFLAVAVTPASGLRAIKIIDSLSRQVFATAFDEAPQAYDPAAFITDASWDESGTIFRFTLAQPSGRGTRFQYSMRSQKLVPISGER